MRLAACYEGENGWCFLQRPLENQRYFGVATARLHGWRLPVATLCYCLFLSALLHLLAGHGVKRRKGRGKKKEKKRKERERQKKERERKKERK
jgi:hypothetical protein